MWKPLRLERLQPSAGPPAHASRLSLVVTHSLKAMLRKLGWAIHGCNGDVESGRSKQRPYQSRIKFSGNVGAELPRRGARGAASKPAPRLRPGCGTRKIKGFGSGGVEDATCSTLRWLPRLRLIDLAGDWPEGQAIDRSHGGWLLARKRRLLAIL